METGEQKGCVVGDGRVPASPVPSWEGSCTARSVRERKARKPVTGVWAEVQWGALPGRAVLGSDRYFWGLLMSRPT